MIDEGQREMCLSILIRFRQQITPPNPIARDRSRHAMFQLFARFIDQVLVPPTGVGDVGFAHGHIPSGGPPPIEVMGNRTTADVWHEGLQRDDFVPHPFRLGHGTESPRP